MTDYSSEADKSFDPLSRLHLLLQGVFLLLIHFNHDFIFLLKDFELVFNMALLTFEGCDCVLQFLVLLCLQI